MSDIIFRRHKKSHNSSFDMTPLLDIIFILLVFLMISSVIARDSIQVNLPAAQTKDTQEKIDYIVVSVDESGLIYLDSKIIKLAEIRSHLKGNSKKVVLRIDKKTQYSKFMNILDQIRISGIEDISLEHE